MLERLMNLFAGKNVRITHSNPRVSPSEGRCATVHQIPGDENHFDIELDDGSRHGFVPEVVTDTYTDGELRAFAGGRRKVEVIS